LADIFLDNNKHASNDSFPGFSEVQQVKKKDNYYIGTPRCNEGMKTFCEDNLNYPQDFMDQLLVENTNLLKYSFQDQVSRIIIIIQSITSGNVNREFSYLLIDT